MRSSKRDSGVRLEVYWVDCIVRRNCGLATETKRKPVLLLHELLGWLWRKDRARFTKILGSADDAAIYWWEVRRHNPTWFREHRYHDAIMRAPRHWLPMKLFGDDARVGKFKAIFVLHAYSAITRERKTRFCKLPALVRNSIDAIKDVTDAPLLDANSWSWECLGENKFPQWNHDRTALLTGWRKKMAGRPICGFHVALVRICGDWQWSAETCHFAESYKVALGDGPICHRCGAETRGDRNYSNFREDAPFWCIERSNADYMASPCAAIAHISRTPGFHRLSVWPELMHGGPLGFNLVVSGSVLKELSDEAEFAPRATSGTWLEKLSLQLAVASSEFKTWQRAVKRPCSHKRFTPRKLDLTKKVRVPTLKAKAYNSLTVSAWLAVKTREVSLRWPGHSYFRDRAAMCWGLVEFYDICKRAGPWMNEAELADLKVARDTTLVCFRRLAGMAKEDGSGLYPIRPKVHIFDECHHIAQTTGENPTSGWTFSDEDNMRVLTMIASSCHGMSVEQSSLEKWIMQFFHPDSDDEAL